MLSPMCPGATPMLSPMCPAATPMLSPMSLSLPLAVAVEWERGPSQEFRPDPRIPRLLEDITPGLQEQDPSWPQRQAHVPRVLLLNKVMHA
jgi:hypothetical protein